MPRRIGHLSLLVLVALSVGNAYLLNSGEHLRIAIIAVGLAGYYWLHLRRLRAEPWMAPRQMVSILALIQVFIFVQFDPAFSGINRSISQDYINWYAVATAMLVSVAFASSVVVAGKEAGARYLVGGFSSWDWAVVSASVITLILISVTSIVSAVPLRAAWFSIAKLLLVVLLYAATITIYRSCASSSAPRGPTGDRTSWILMWRALGGAVFVVLMIGAGKNLYVKGQVSSGTELIQRGAYQEAVGSLERALNLSGGRHEACQIALAEALLGLDETKAAQAQIASARHLYSGSRTLEKRIGDALSRAGRWEWAIDVYCTEGNKIGEALVYDELARAFLATGKMRDLTDMIRRQDRAPTIGFESTEDQVQMAMCLLGAGRLEDVKRELESASKRSVGSWLVEYGKGVLANRMLDWEEGAEHLRRAVDLAPSELDPRLALATALIELGRFEEVEEQATHVLKNDSERIPALGQLASVYAARSETDSVNNLVGRMTVSIDWSQWQGPQKGGLGAAGVCWYDLELSPGELTVSIKASGTQAGGVSPLMIVSIDQEEIGSVSVNQSDTYSFRSSIEKTGSYRLSVYFPNDSSSDEPGDRNLYVHGATLQYLSIAR